MREGTFNYDEGRIMKNELRTQLFSGKQFEEVAFNVSEHVQMTDDDIFGEILCLKTSAGIIEFCSRNELEDIFKILGEKMKKKRKIIVEKIMKKMKKRKQK
jgi:hypothetical protein